MNAVTVGEARRGGIRRRSAVERVLTACVREHDWTTSPAEVVGLLPSIDQAALVEAARLHRVSTAVLLSTGRAPGFPASYLQVLRASSRASLMRSLQVENETRFLSAALGPVPWMVVKGPALARGYYRRSDVRSYGDLDVVVPPHEFADALNRLEVSGFALLDRNWTRLTEQLAGELHLLSPRGVVVDLHWSLVNDQATRAGYALPTSLVFERAELLRIADTDVMTLDPLDTLVHTAVHAARAGGDRLVWLKDLEQLVLSGRWTWKDLAVRSAELRAELVVTVMLHRMRAALDVPGVSDSALKSIGGAPVWRILGRAVDRFAPVVRAGSDGSLTRMYARAIRADGRSFAGELGRRMVARARRGTWPEESVTWDRTHPDSLLYDAGGSRGRAAYLSAVSQQ